MQARAAADAALQQSLIRLNAVAENYPELKANVNFLELQSQLAETENQIAFSRQYYNDAVATLNKLVLTIPWMFFTGIANVHKREFYDAPEGQQTAPTVSFDTGGGAAAAGRTAGGARAGCSRSSGRTRGAGRSGRARGPGHGAGCAPAAPPAAPPAPPADGGTPPPAP